jgi:hypothetical protein
MTQGQVGEQASLHSPHKAGAGQKLVAGQMGIGWGLAQGLAK